jgi:hypothetical protein
MMGRRSEFLALIRRANALGALLPADIAGIEANDPSAVAELRLILLEFDRVVTAIWAFGKPTN